MHISIATLVAAGVRLPAIGTFARSYGNGRAGIAVELNVKILAMLLALSVTFVGLGADRTPEDYLGKKMPAFAMKDVAGKRFTNASTKGKVVILDFWATWCTVCQRVSPIMDDLSKKYSAKGLVVIGADVAEKTRGTAARYQKRHHYGYHFTENNDKLADVLGITPLPTVIVIDRKGVVRKVEISYYSNFAADMQKVVGGLLAEKG